MQVRFSHTLITLFYLFCDRFGFRCRFLGGHVRTDEAGALRLIKDEDKIAYAALASVEANRLSPQAQKLLQRKKVLVYRETFHLTLTCIQYPFPIATAYQKELEGSDKSKPVPTAASIVIAEPDQDMDDVDSTTLPPKPSTDELIAQRTGDADVVAQVDTPDVPARFMEKKRLDWEGKTCKIVLACFTFLAHQCSLDLAPLTTVGNLVLYFTDVLRKNKLIYYSPSGGFAYHTARTSPVARVGRCVLYLDRSS
jgi:tRNA-dihydrouridine synthase 3